MNNLAKSLKQIDYFALSFGSIIGVGWLIRSGDWLDKAAPLGTLVAFLGCTLLLIPVAICYALLMGRFPKADSEVAYLNNIAPRKIQFVAGWSITLAYLVICPWEALALTELLTKVWSNLENLPLVKFVISFFVLLLIWFLNMTSISLASNFQKICVYLLVILLLYFAYLSFTLGNSENLKPYFTNNPIEGIFKLIQVVPYFLMGFEVSARTSEESVENFPRVGYRLPVIASLILAGIFYSVIIITASLLVPWEILKGKSFALLNATETATSNNHVATTFIIIVALFSLIKVLNGNFIAASRMTFSLSRNGFIPQGLSSISKESKVPFSAITFIVSISILGIFLGKNGLDILSQIGSFAISVAWLFTSIACIQHSRKSEFANQKLPMISGIFGALVSLCFIAIQTLWFIPGHLEIMHICLLAVWLVLGYLLSLKK